jgi:transcriptional regulator with XRE-family HTH domain
MKKMTENELRIILSANIKYYRGLHGWSQVVFAEKLGISTNFLADIETGKSWVSSQTLTRLGNILDVDIFELFKPPISVTEDEKGTLSRFMKDVSLTFHHSLGKIAKEYSV